jgi:hypothetical protein
VSVLWPRLPDAVAHQEYEKVRAGAECIGADQHPEQVYAPVGARVEPRQIGDFARQVTELAAAHGYPARSSDAERVAFDRACAPVLRRLIDVSWAEAGSRPMWSFVALVALPHVTHWRFGTNNAERWVASDLTRHTWARLWWQAVVFDADPALMSRLTESDLNQLFEKRQIGGDPRLVRSIAAAVVETDLGTLSRRAVIRDATKRLLRRLAFIDIRALNDDRVLELCRLMVRESVTNLGRTPTQ